MTLTPAERRLLGLLILLLSLGYAAEILGWHPPEPLPPGPLARPAAEPEPVRSGRLDLNAASQSDLESLPGIGPALAERILRQRERTGGFRSLEELLEVRGVGPKTLERIRPFVALGSSRRPDSSGS
jgi:competence ComEA-like helix-hairpin-helix protein